jgi:hypothetical protein
LSEGGTVYLVHEPAGQRWVDGHGLLPPSESVL